MQVLVVGASRGIGLELVRQQRAQGHEVSATARDADALQRLAALGARPLRLDLLDAASVAGLAWQLDGRPVGHGRELWMAAPAPGVHEAVVLLLGEGSLSEARVRFITVPAGGLPR